MKVLLVVFGSSWGDLDNVEHSLKKAGIEYDIVYPRRGLWPAAEGYDIIVQLGLSKAEDEGIAFLPKLCAIYPGKPILLATQHLSREVERKVRDAAPPQVEYLMRQVANGYFIAEKLREMLQKQTAPSV